MKKNRHRKHGFLLLVVYLVLLTYFLFFAEELGRNPGTRAEYSYNLTLFKEIRRFLVYRDVLGWRAVILNVFGNMVVFVPFGFILPEVWDQLNHWYTITFMGFLFSLFVETTQLVSRVGCFDVDDLLLNTVGALVGYCVFVMAKGVWNQYLGTDRK